MFTSRAEHRLLLREDNADFRLTPAGRDLGLVDDQRWSLFERKYEAVEAEKARLSSLMVRQATLTAKDFATIGQDMTRESTASDLLRRPELSYRDVVSLSAVGSIVRDDSWAAEEIEQVELQLEVQAKYQGYIERQQREIEKQARQESLRLPANIDYSRVSGLSNEARQRLERHRPLTLGQAGRLEGVTPATISLLLIHIKKSHIKQTA
jgi:tRNA uridine 5-carboxymethylaminomethyl modification enzyme